MEIPGTHDALGCGLFVVLASLLEGELECQLHNAPRPNRLDLPEARRIDVVIRQLEVDVVEDVEDLGAELDAHAFADGNGLDR